MRYSDAVRLYFERNPQSAGVLKKLMSWNARLSIAQNQSKLGMYDYAAAHRLAYKFGLKFKDENERKTARQKIFARGVEKLQDMGYTYEQIGKLHGVSRQRIETMMRRLRQRKGVRLNDIRKDHDPGHARTG